MNEEKMNHEETLRYILRICPWYETKCRKWEHFYIMNSRLISDPESNFKYWDIFEAKQIESYLARCVQLHEYMRHNKKFMDNWNNLKIALDHVNHLRAKYEPLPYNKNNTDNDDEFDIDLDEFMKDEMPIKQAIQEKKVVIANSSFFSKPGSLEALERAYSDLSLCCDLEDPTKSPVELTVDEYMSKRKDNSLLALYLKMYNKTERLILRQ